MRIIRHRNGPKKSLAGKYQCVVIGANFCIRHYLCLFRGYQMKFQDKDVIFKEIVPDRKMVDRKTAGIC